MQRLIIGDIHGCWNELQTLIDQAGLSRDDEIIAIGDFVDRGPDSPRVLEFIQTQLNVRALQGNHERKHIRSARDEVKAALSQRITRQQLGDAYANALAFFESLPLYFDFPEAIVVHGYWEPGLSIANQRETVLAGTMGGEKHLRENYERPWYELYDSDKPIIVEVKLTDTLRTKVSVNLTSHVLGSGNPTSAKRLAIRTLLAVRDSE